jgi:hypothetical protein
MGKAFGGAKVAARFEPRRPLILNKERRLMRVDRMIRFSAGALAFMMMLAAGSVAVAQLPDIVINEIVDDIRTAGSGAADDDREFIELYNAGATAVNIGDWTLNYWVLGSTAGAGAYAPTNDTIPSGTMLAPGDYYVVGHPNVLNVDLEVDFLDLFPDLNTVYELRNGPQLTGALVDAVGSETFRAQELGNAKPEHLPEVGRGWWGQMISTNSDAPNLVYGLARYEDGRDTNSNGWDFGVLPVTPGTSNNLPQVASYAVPDVEALPLGSNVTSTYASFILPRVIDPTVVDGINPKDIGFSPTGGKAIMTYDESGGGNVAYSKELVNSFRLSAYVDTGALNSATAADVTDSEATIYGIGTSDPFFASPDSGGLLGFGSSANGSTGLGWLIQRVETFNTETSSVNPTETIVQLLNMKGGGEGVQDIESTDWEVIQTIPVTGLASGWHTLGIDYDPTTGAVVATYDNQTFNFNADDGMLGTFYVGYREDLGGDFTNSRPPTYDIAPAAVANDADFDNDGDVDGADFLTWQRNVGGAATPGNGNANGDAVIDGADLAVWKAQFGQTPPIAVIPEPGAFALAFAALCLAGCGGKPRLRQPLA